jgi:hypothetical protein
MVLVCNARATAVELIDRWHPAADSVRSARVASLLPTAAFPDRAGLALDARYRESLGLVQHLIA